jgi:hypothetical protein
MARPKAVPKRPKWRNIPDEVILALVSHQLDRAESLCPGPSTVERAASGDPIAVGIIDSWKPIFTIVLVATWKD